MLSRKMLIMNPSDNVGVLLEDARQGEECVFQNVQLAATSDIEFGHKIALSDIETGADILKYGHKIGYATQPIRRGEWVHVHNVESERGR